MAKELELLLAQCGNLHKDKKYKEITQLLTDELLEKYKDANLVSWAAYAYSFLDEKKQAIDYYTKAIKFNNKFSLAYNNRGNIYNLLKEWKKALDDLNEAINLNPTYTLAFRNRGETYLGIEKFELAISDFEKALALDYDKYNFLETIIEEAKENLLLGELSKNKKEIKELRNKMEENVLAILRETREEKVKYVAHYTKLGVVKSIVEKSIEIKKEDKRDDGPRRMNDEVRNFSMEKEINGLWYFNVIYMNDPEEGEILFKHFLTDKKIKECFENGKRANETSVYLGCFLSADEDNAHEDDLVMWRTYGKDERKNEAAGCSMVISSDFFDKEEDNIKYRKMELRMATDLGSEPTEVKQPQGLLKVIYLNKNKVTKGISFKIRKELTSLKSNLDKLIKLRNGKDRKEEEKKLIDKIIFEKLSKICYLFKSSDYAFENEIRVVEYVPLGSKKIKKLKLQAPENTFAVNEQPPARLYIESNKDVLPYTAKIYLGAKVPNHNHWSTYLDYEIRQREKEREKGNIGEREIKIEVIKSTCNFQ